MIIGVPVESFPGEHRVGLIPAVVKDLSKAGLDVLVEKGAGERAGYPDDEFEARGARIAQDRDALFAEAELSLLVHGPANGGSLPEEDLARLRAGTILLGMLNPLGAPGAMRDLAGRGVAALSLEFLPRTSRAQPMDVLTSMATIAGYKASLMAANAIQKLYPMMVTPAGTITPAKIFVLGAGVAGLQAIATSRRLGGVVTAYDVRPEVREQVESLGGKFLEIGLETGEASAEQGYAKALGDDFYRRQQEAMAEAIAECDAVITTAAVPGKKAPVLIPEETVRRMRAGSVIVDLAAEGGGNCALTRAGEKVSVGGVTILGPVNVPSMMATHASQMFARNVTSFLRHAAKEGTINLETDDSIVRDPVITQGGEVVHPKVRSLLDPEPASPAVS